MLPLQQAYEAKDAIIEYLMLFMRLYKMTSMVLRMNHIFL